MLAVHCSFTEEMIDDFTVKFYRDCIRELDTKIRYESISHLFANPYAKDVVETVEKHNPFSVDIEGSNVNKDKAKPTLNLLKNMGLLKYTENGNQ